MRDEPTLEELGWNADFEEALADARDVFGEVDAGRVYADFGVELGVVSSSGFQRATLAGRLRFEEGARPAVGDFVCLTGVPGSHVVVDVLPRRSYLARQAPGQKTGVQLIASNLDQVFVVTSFNEDFNINRVERYFAAIREGGAEPVVVVNKADLVEPPEVVTTIGELRERLGEGVGIVAASALAADGLDELRELLRPGETSSFVGSSGVGKSTIVNVLLGEEKQPTAEIREFDSRGRHTTTHREMFVLPNGALVIDTPGMREFQLWELDDETDAFEDIAELAADCKFRDCSHDSEPGCAVIEAARAGGLDADRLESWRKLRREGEFQRLRKDEAARRGRNRDFARVVKEAKKIKRSLHDSDPE